MNPLLPLLPSIARIAGCVATAMALLALPAAVAAKGGSGSGGGSSGGDAEVPGEILLKLKSSGALGPLLARYPLTLQSQFGARPIYRVKTIGSVRTKDVLPALQLEPEVMIAEPNVTHRSPEARHNLPWTIGNPTAYTAQWAPAAIGLPAAQQLSLGAGIRVAVLDTGVDRSHPLLAGRLLPGYDFVDDDNDPSEAGSTANPGFGHGTHVTGLVALVAPAAKIMPLRVLDADGNGNAWVLAEALLHALDPDHNPATDDGAHVINLSLGSLARTRVLAAIAMLASCAPAIDDDPIADRSDPGYRDDETRCAGTGGAVVVAAAGNGGSSSIKEYPAAEGAYGLLPVTASDARSRLADFANTGPWIDLAAPGEGITSTMPGGGMATWSGTSMAAPLAAGAAALVRAYNPAWPAKDVVRALFRTSVALCGTNIGLLDVPAALRNRIPTSNTPCR